MSSGVRGADGGPLLVVLSGPSGVGKDTVLDRMRQLRPDAHYTVTATTRPPRPGEENGREYRFLSDAQFQDLLAQDELLEHARVYDRWYGVPKAPVREALSRGQDVIVRVDVQGAATIRSKVPEAVLVFLEPPSLEELERRLRQRRTESDEQLALRLETAKREMAEASRFDHVVVNLTDALDETVERIVAILDTERSRVPPRQVRI